MAKGTKKMIIMKTVCDVPDKNGPRLFGHLICGEPAIGIGGRVLYVMFGKEEHHLCAKHTELSIAQVCKLFRGEEEIAPIDDWQR
jgi:hypothetical protein